MSDPPKKWMLKLDVETELQKVAGNIIDYIYAVFFLLNPPVRFQQVLNLLIKRGVLLHVLKWSVTVTVELHGVYLIALSFWQALTRLQ